VTLLNDFVNVINYMHSACTVMRAIVRSDSGSVRLVTACVYAYRCIVTLCTLYVLMFMLKTFHS